MTPVNLRQEIIEFTQRMNQIIKNDQYREYEGIHAITNQLDPEMDGELIVYSEHFAQKALVHELYQDIYTESLSIYYEYFYTLLSGRVLDNEDFALYVSYRNMLSAMMEKISELKILEDHVFKNRPGMKFHSYEFTVNSILFITHYLHFIGLDVKFFGIDSRFKEKYQKALKIYKGMLKNREITQYHFARCIDDLDLNGNFEDYVLEHLIGEEMKTFLSNNLSHIDEDTDFINQIC